MKGVAWLRQALCSHTECAWETWPDPNGGITATITTGGCVRCGKRMAPPCERCGK